MNWYSQFDISTYYLRLFILYGYTIGDYKFSNRYVCLFKCSCPGPDKKRTPMSCVLSDTRG